MKVENQVPEKSWNMGVDLGVFDKLLYQYQMRADLRQAQNKDQPWPALTYQVADKRKLKRYDFEILQEEMVKTGIGHLQTLKITRKRPAAIVELPPFGSRLNTTLCWCVFSNLKMMAVASSCYFQTPSLTVKKSKPTRFLATSRRFAPDTCHLDLCRRSHKLRQTQKTAFEPHPRLHKSLQAVWVVFENSSVTCPSHSGSSGVTFTIMPHLA